ncbi:hypothetical protein [uncultured Thalassospira sp.]|uniref:hypothetical protein n=1 Tax=uncultured Thalassospira sp. TaxID=404382 RepID=UPI0030DD4D59
MPPESQKAQLIELETVLLLAYFVSQLPATAGGVAREKLPITASDAPSIKRYLNPPEILIFFIRKTPLNNVFAMPLQSKNDIVVITRKGKQGNDIQSN